MPGKKYSCIQLFVTEKMKCLDHGRLRKPLVVFEALEVDYPWASDRLHGFIIEGMYDNARAFAATPVTYFPYVEPRPNDGRGLLESFARSACLVVTDDFPCFFLPRVVAAAAARLDVRLEVVDGNGLIPRNGRFSARCDR
jgi:deoxyribodipyrimidine photo-lyase